MRIAQGLGLGTRLPDQPQPRRLRDLARAPGAGQVVQRPDGPDRCGSPGTASHPLPTESKPGCRFTHASARRQLQHDAGALGMVTGGGARRAGSPELNGVTGRRQGVKKSVRR
jgi:hypothetical protein